MECKIAKGRNFTLVRVDVVDTRYSETRATRHVSQETSCKEHAKC